MGARQRLTANADRERPPDPPGRDLDSSTTCRSDGAEPKWRTTKAKRKVARESLSRVLVPAFAASLLFVTVALSLHSLLDTSARTSSKLHGSSTNSFSPNMSSSNQSTWSAHTARQEERMLSNRKKSRILTIYTEPTTTLASEQAPLPQRATSASKLTKHKFPKLSIVNCSGIGRQGDEFHPPVLPIDDFPDSDPFLPWIHDYFVTPDASEVRFLAQNKRRCETGDGKEGIMKYWEPQIALFQPVPIQRQQTSNGTIYKLSTVENATFPDTRFLCQFQDGDSNTETTLSRFPFNYEFVSWRKRRRPMFRESGRDVDLFQLSQLLFSCPVPAQFRQHLVRHGGEDMHLNNGPRVWLDVVPIRTPARRGFLMTEEQVGSTEYEGLNKFNAGQHYGSEHILPSVPDSGRWANLALCPRQDVPSLSDPSATLQSLRRKAEASSETVAEAKKHHFVACTWTAASYMRRGDAHTVDDSTLRLREWIIFHQMVGLDHLYVYDNTKLLPTEESPLVAIVREFPGFVTYIPWPATVCSNNRPTHKNPGERSSQYGAEASCRARFGASTEWMAFVDIDEYLVPMQNDTWRPLLEDMRRRKVHVLKMRSTRGRPRVDLMETFDDLEKCRYISHRNHQLPTQDCIVPRRNETFLRVYSCDFIKPPLPKRFDRAMKQIYRPEFVLSHFVHYATVTTEIAKYYSQRTNPQNFTKRIQDVEWGDIFLNELTEGTLVHAKSVLPHETMTRNATCHLGSRHVCQVGYQCSASTFYQEIDHDKNLFYDDKGNYCNCWINQRVEQHFAPKLARVLFGGAAPWPSKG